MDLDTGSASMWVYGESCTAAPCEGHAKFNSSASLTVEPDFKINEDLFGGVSYSVSYGEGELSRSLCRVSRQPDGQPFSLDCRAAP